MDGHFAILKDNTVIKGKTTIHHAYDGMYIEYPNKGDFRRVSEISSMSEYNKVHTLGDDPIIVIPYSYGTLYLDEQIKKHWSL